MKAIRTGSWLAVLVVLAGAYAANGKAGASSRTPRQEKPAAETQEKKTPDYSQEAFVLEQFSIRTRFEKDGTGRREMTVRVRVQSEEGVQQLGQLVFGYNSANEKLASSCGLAQGRSSAAAPSRGNDPMSAKIDSCFTDSRPHPGLRGAAAADPADPMATQGAA